MKTEPSAIAIIVKAAASKQKGLGELQRELARRGIDSTYTQLSNAAKGLTRTLESDVLLECVEIGFDGDWNKARKAVRLR